jgi:Leucine-rich repeat (LRR) protein
MHISYSDLSGNLLTELKAGLFSNLSSLAQLDLSRNQLAGLKKKKILWELPSLERLSLASNRITDIPDMSFKTMVSLRVLDLSNNHLRALPSEALVGLKVRSYLRCIFIFKPKYKYLFLTFSVIRFWIS